MTFTLRRATESDRTYIQRLNYLADVHGDESRSTSEDSLDTLAAYVEAWDPDRDGGVIAFDAHGTPAGGVWLRYWPSPDEGWANIAPDVPEIAIAVENRYAGHRLGATLLDAACDLARSQGATRIALHVDPNNPRAHHRYSSFGFAEVDAGREITMVLDLA